MRPKLYPVHGTFKDDRGALHEKQGAETSLAQ